MIDLSETSLAKLTEHEQLTLINNILRSWRCTHTSPASALIPILQKIQEKLGYIPRHAITQISMTLNIPTSRIVGVVTFYHQFRLHPEGKHKITLCKGTACHINGADTNLLALHRCLNKQTPSNLTEDSHFTISEVRCIGACSLAPILKIDNDIYGNVNPTMVPKILTKYQREYLAPHG